MENGNAFEISITPGQLICKCKLWFLVLSNNSSTNIIIYYFIFDFSIFKRIHLYLIGDITIYQEDLYYLKSLTGIYFLYYSLYTLSMIVGSAFKLDTLGQ